jgi:protein ImuA
MTDRLAHLRARISALEALPALAGERPAAALGLREIDAALPWGGLPAGGLHEIRAANGSRPAVALGFAAFCLSRLARSRAGPLLWVTMSDDLYPPGLAGLGLPTARLLMVRPVRQAEALASLEEILRCQAVAGVLGEVNGLDFKAARRLSLASRASGVPVLLLNRGAALAATLTRWQIAAQPSESRFGIGVGAWRWRVALTFCRGMAMGEIAQAPHWTVEVKDATGALSLVALSQHRSPAEIGQCRAG